MAHDQRPSCRLDGALEPGDRIALSAFIRLEGITKRFGTYPAVAGIDLEIARGEFVSLLGPSGCGKTTTLNIVAGFLQPDAGRVIVDGLEVQRLPAHRRNMGMVFQSYALFPHLTAEQNVAFGLRLRKLSRTAIRERVERALALVHLREVAGRYPRELSGGQQQRVAVARALVVEPLVLLLDEPFSNLDARLRARLRTELREIQREVGITTIFVTHDQEEALALSDRVAVMNEGRIEHIGTPAEIYHAPKTPFVAQFVGDVNAISARLATREGKRVTVDVGEGRVLSARDASDAALGETVFVYIRPEAVRIEAAAAAAPSETAFAGRIERVEFLGGRRRYAIRCAPGVLVAERLGEVADALPAGTEVLVSWHPDDANVFAYA